MKTNRITCLLLAVLLVVSSLATTVSATSLSLSEEEAVVYVDDKEVKKIDAYVDDEGDIYVSTVKEIYQILPELEDEVYIISSKEYSVTYYLSKYTSYSYYIYDNELYIYTEEAPVIDLGNIFDSTEVEDDDDVEKETATVYVNGLLVSTKSAFITDGEAFVNKTDDIYKIFPKETKKLNLSSKDKVRSLKDWAKKYSYTYILDENKVYLNNDGNLPVKILLDGKEISFPDQQAVIVSPGRTMVPVSSIAELIGAKVTWNAKYQRVTIEGDSNKLVLWIGSKTFNFNGKSYKMDVAPYAVNGRTMLPIAFVGQAFKLNVKFEDKSDIDIVKLSSAW